MGVFFLSEAETYYFVFHQGHIWRGSYAPSDLIQIFIIIRYVSKKTINTCLNDKNSPHLTRISSFKSSLFRNKADAKIYILLITQMIILPEKHKHCRTPILRPLPCQEVRSCRVRVDHLRLVLFKSLRNCKRRIKGNFTLMSNSNKIMLCGGGGK